MSDEITLTLPPQKPFYGVAHLVLGGLAVRLDLSFKTLEDLQLAVEGLLDRAKPDEDVTVSVRVHEGTLDARIAPIDAEALKRELAREAGDEISLRRVLDTVVDRVVVGESAGEHWVELSKSVTAGTA